MFAHWRIVYSARLAAVSSHACGRSGTPVEVPLSYGGEQRLLHGVLAGVELAVSAPDCLHVRPARVWRAVAARSVATTVPILGYVWRGGRWYGSVGGRDVGLDGVL